MPSSTRSRTASPRSPVANVPLSRSAQSTGLISSRSSSQSDPLVLHGRQVLAVEGCQHVDYPLLHPHEVLGSDEVVAPCNIGGPVEPGAQPQALLYQLEREAFGEAGGLILPSPDQVVPIERNPVADRRRKLVLLRGGVEVVDQRSNPLLRSARRSCGQETPLLCPGSASTPPSPPTDRCARSPGLRLMGRTSRPRPPFVGRPPCGPRRRAAYPRTRRSPRPSTRRRSPGTRSLRP